MKNYSPVVDPKDISTKEYVDTKVPKKLSELEPDTEHETVSQTEKENWDKSFTEEESVLSASRPPKQKNGGMWYRIV